MMIEYNKYDYPVLQGVCRPVDKCFGKLKDVAEQFISTINPLETLVISPAVRNNDRIVKLLGKDMYNIKKIPVGTYCLIWGSLYCIARCTIENDFCELSVIDCSEGTIRGFYTVSINQFCVNDSGNLYVNKSDLILNEYATVENGSICLTLFVPRLISYFIKSRIRKITLTPNKPAGVIDDFVFVNDLDVPINIFDLKPKYKTQSPA